MAIEVYARVLSGARRAGREQAIPRGTARAAAPNLWTVAGGGGRTGSCRSGGCMLATEGRGPDAVSAPCRGTFPVRTSSGRSGRAVPRTRPNPPGWLRLRWLLLCLVLLAGAAAPSAVPARAESSPHRAYLRGHHRVLFRVTARGSDIPPPLLDHCTLTFAQRVLARGQAPGGAYVDLEVRTSLPPAIATRVSYPLDGRLLPDSVRPYLRGSETRGERALLERLLDRIGEPGSPAYEDEKVEEIVDWVVRHVAYDSTTALDQSPLAVLERRRATCAGYAELSIALLRLAGIPARRIGCVIPPDCGWGRLGRGGRHAYIETFYPDVGWLATDPLRSYHFVDPFHLVTRVDVRGVALGYDTLDFELLEDDAVMQFAPLVEAPEHLRYSPVLREAERPVDLWVPYQFRHRRPDGAFVHVSVRGDQVVSSRDGCRETTYHTGETEMREPDGTRRYRFPSGGGSEMIDRPDGSRETLFADGTRILSASDGTEEVHYANGDHRSTRSDGTVVYLFAGGDRKTTWPDGTQLIEWTNGARELRPPPGAMKVD